MSFSTVITLDGQTCIHADPAKYPSVVRTANSYWCPVGPMPGKAWVLMVRSAMMQVARNTPVTLAFNRTGDGARTNSFTKLYFVGAKRVLRGGPEDDNSLFLVELEDVRRLCQMSGTQNAQYNVRGWSMGETYLDGTEDTSAPWTWAGMVGDLWGKVGHLGTFPGLPYTPHGTPESWKFIGVSAWDALHQVLAKLYCTTVYNPATGSFAIVELGAEQSGIDALSNVLTFDGEPEDAAAKKIPENIRVHFHTHHVAYGQERDTENENNWSVARPVHIETVATGVTGAVAGTTVDLWDDLAAVYDDTDTLSNTAALNARAVEIAGLWVQERQTTDRHRVYVGIDNSILPGEQIRAVLWRHWGKEAGGGVTEIVSHHGMPKPYGGGMMAPAGMPLADRLRPPDLGRSSYPNFPRLPNMVEITGPVDGEVPESPGDELDPDGDGFWEGKIVRYVGGAMVDLGDVKVMCPEYEAGKPRLKLGQVVMGRLSGVDDGEAVYLAELPGRGELASVAAINAAPSQWTNGEEFTPGCQVISGEIVEGCGVEGKEGNIDIVVPHVRGKVPILEVGDHVGIAPVDMDANPPLYVITTDYTGYEEDCGIEITDEGKIRFDNKAAAGLGLLEGEDCSLDVDIGCGLHFVGNEIWVDPEDLAGPGLVESGSCGLAVNAGCGLKIDADVLLVDNKALAGQGLVATQVCELEVNYGCGLNIDTGQLVLDFKVNEGNVSGISFDKNCFEVDGNEKCGTAAVSLKIGSPTQEFEYVYKAECVEGETVYYTKFAQFTACGLFTGTSDESLEE